MGEAAPVKTEKIGLFLTLRTHISRRRESGGGNTSQGPFYGSGRSNETPGAGCLGKFGRFLPTEVGEATPVKTEKIGLFLTLRAHKSRRRESAG